MITRLAVCAALSVVAGCGGNVPDSNPNVGGGVGFGSYDSYQVQRDARDRVLEQGQVAGSPISDEQVIASEALGVLNATRTASAPAPDGGPRDASVGETSVEVASVDNAAISDEQDFNAVSERESIESDAERLRRQRDSMQVVAPQAIPERPSDSGPNIVAYALSTSNIVGQQVYRRSGTVSDSKYQRACARFSSSDQAQEAFLKAGGPKNDRRGLDPDGDGFACFWDPMPFRSARGG